MDLDEDVRNKLFFLISRSSRSNLINTLAGNNLDTFINGLGLGKISEAYTELLMENFEGKMKSFSKVNLTAERIQMISTNMNSIINTNERRLVGYFSAETENIRTSIVNSVIGGETFPATVRSLKEKTGYNNQQIGTIINTSYSDVGRTTTRLAFIEDPDQLFECEGGIIPASSDECKWLYKEQKKEGYTMKAIDAGIDTPYTYTYGNLKGQTKKIYWGGRFPNYNCIHEWLPL